MKKKVIVAMSGGVDSSVAAALLLEQGYEVEGMFMKNWSPESMQSLTDCPWEVDQADAAAVCEHLGIPFRSINFEREYKERVVDYFLGEYAAGRTPNPDVLCNKEIKFAAFLEEALKANADYIATGHYARTLTDKAGTHLLRGLDNGKDQSYFLYTLGQEKLVRSLFPLGEMQKSEVRELAAKFKLPTATKKDSQGICFIGHIDLKKFLQEHITSKPGFTYLLPDYDPEMSWERRLKRALVVGKHTGSVFYTLGERAGAIVDNGMYRMVSGKTDVPPLYVVHKDFIENAIYCSANHQDENLLVTEFSLENWQGPTPLSEINFSEGVGCQVRYQQRDMSGVKSFVAEGGEIKVVLESPSWAVAPGQSAVFYKDETLLGGGIIKDISHS